MNIKLIFILKLASVGFFQVLRPLFHIYSSLPFVFLIRERTGGAVVAVLSPCLPGGEFHLPATSRGPRGLHSPLQPDIRP